MSGPFASEVLTQVGPLGMWTHLDLNRLTGSFFLEIKVMKLGGLSSPVPRFLRQTKSQVVPSLNFIHELWSVCSARRSRPWVSPA